MIREQGHAFVRFRARPGPRWDEELQQIRLYEQDWVIWQKEDAHE